MLVLERVEKRFGDFVAIPRLNLTFEAGQTTALIGPSGCGKSTVLRILNGLIRPDAGSVSLQGTRLTPTTVRALRQRMAYLLQGGGLFPHLTARENATLMARYLGWPRDRIQTRLDELLTLTRFPTAALMRYPAEISGGQRQRLALMRALMLDPKVLLLDEPFGALDPIIRRELQQELREIFTQLGRTVVLVTHDLGEAAFLARRVVLMNEGKVIQQGRLESLLKAPADPFVTRFVNAQRSWLDEGGAS